MESITMTKEALVALVNETAEVKAADLVEAAVAKAIEAAGIKAAPATHKFGYRGAASEKSAEEFAAMEKKEKIASFVKAVYHKDQSSLSVFKAMTEGVGAAGGFIVPEEFAAEVNRVVEDFGLVPKLARKFPMKTDTMNVPRLSASVSISFPGEATAGTPSQPTFESVVLSAKTMVGLTPMSNELLADADVSVVDLLVELFSEAIAGMMDQQGLTGTGSPFNGILTDTGVAVVQPGAGNSTFALCSTPDNLRDLISNVKPWSMQGAAYIMHRTVWAIVQKQKTSGSGEYFFSAANPQLSGNADTSFPLAMAGTLWGYPVYLSDKMPSSTAISTKYVIFGNLKNLYVGMRQEMGVAVSQEGTVNGVSMFETNMSAVRVIARVAIAVGLPTAFAVLKTSAS